MDGSGYSPPFRMAVFGFLGVAAASLFGKEVKKHTSDFVKASKELDKLDQSLVNYLTTTDKAFFQHFHSLHIKSFAKFSSSGITESLEYLINNCPNLIHIDFSTYTSQFFDKNYTNTPSKLTPKQKEFIFIRTSTSDILKSITLIKTQPKRPLEFVLNPRQLTKNVQEALNSAPNITFRVINVEDE